MSNKHYAVLGLGLSGVSAVNFLLDQGFIVSASDNKLQPLLIANIQENSNLNLNLGKLVIPHNSTHIVISPGIAFDSIDNPRKLPIIGDIELFSQYIDVPVIAVTGSNGKSTTASLIHYLLQECGINAGLGGNIGVPALSLLQNKYAVCVLELSSFQLESTSSLRPFISMILNISPDHLDRYSNMENYTQAKQRIYQNANYVIYNTMQQATAPSRLELTNQVAIGSKDSTYYIEHGIIYYKDQPQIHTKELILVGAHNHTNLLFALNACHLMGVIWEQLKPVLLKFRGLEHRCEQIPTKEKTWINDSKGTNVGATLAALDGLKDTIRGKWLLILGGEPKNQDFSLLCEPIMSHCKAVILIGRAQAQLLALLKNSIQCYIAENLQEAVSIAENNSNSTDGILLSPACASFDMFKDYKDRGQQFKQAVLNKL